MVDTMDEKRKERVKKKTEPVSEFHKDKLMKFVKDEVTAMFEKILDYADVAVSNSDQFKKLRSKVLRSGNNCIRNISMEVKANYQVAFIPPTETIVEINQLRKS